LERRASRRPITPKQPDRSVVPRIGRVQDRTLRACYLCEAIHGQPGVFESESLYHMLMVCPNLSMLNVRERLKTDLENLCLMDADPMSLKPPEFGEPEMWAVMMLCTTAASLPPQPLQNGRGRRGMRIRAISVEENRRARKIRSMPVIHNRARIAKAASWIYAVSHGGVEK
jgi:hypothetical protein